MTLDAQVTPIVDVQVTPRPFKEDMMYHDHIYLYRQVQATMVNGRDGKNKLHWDDLEGEEVALKKCSRGGMWRVQTVNLPVPFY